MKHGLLRNPDRSWHRLRRKTPPMPILEVCWCASALLIHPVQEERIDTRKYFQHGCAMLQHVVLFTPQSIIKQLNIWEMGAAMCHQMPCSRTKYRHLCRLRVKLKWRWAQLWRPLSLALKLVSSLRVVSNTFLVKWTYLLLSLDN